MRDQVSQAVAVLRKGGVIAYPTEHCFGLGCDPQNEAAVKRLTQIKRRSLTRGVLLIAASIHQIEVYADLNSSPLCNEVKESWPGPHTWTLTPTHQAKDWVIGSHATIAVRVSAHPVCVDLCKQFDGAIVSSSANRHGEPVFTDADTVECDMGEELDLIVRASVGGALAPSQIRDGQSGEVLR